MSTHDIAAKAASEIEGSPDAAELVTAIILRAIESAQTELVAEIERRDRWIVGHCDHWIGDHACATCFPGEAGVIPGFKCVVCKARARVAELETALKSEEADVRNCDRIIDELHGKIAELERERDKAATNAVQQMEARHEANSRAAGFEADLTASRADAERLAGALEKCGVDADRLDSVLLRLLKDEDCRGEALGLVNCHAGAFADRESALASHRSAASKENGTAAPSKE